ELQLYSWQIQGWALSWARTTPDQIARHSRPSDASITCPRTFFPVMTRGAHVISGFPRRWHRCKDLPMQQSMTRIWALRLIALLCATPVCVPSVSALELTAQLLGQVQARFGPETRGRVERWQQLLDSPATLPESRKLLLVNS